MSWLRVDLTLNVDLQSRCFDDFSEFSIEVSSGLVLGIVMLPTRCWQWIFGYFTFSLISALAADNVLLKVRMKYPLPDGEYPDWVYVLECCHP